MCSEERAYRACCHRVFGQERPDVDAFVSAWSLVCRAKPGSDSNAIIGGRMFVACCLVRAFRTSSGFVTAAAAKDAPEAARNLSNTPKSLFTAINRIKLDVAQLQSKSVALAPDLTSSSHCRYARGQTQIH